MHTTCKITINIIFQSFMILKTWRLLKIIIFLISSFPKLELIYPSCVLLYLLENNLINSSEMVYFDSSKDLGKQNKTKTTTTTTTKHDNRMTQTLMSVLFVLLSVFEKKNSPNECAICAILHFWITLFSVIVLLALLRFWNVVIRAILRTLLQILISNIINVKRSE